jgi:hypothetical protein
MILFVIMETLLLLNTQFPTFGVLFYTVGRAKNKILFFLMVTLDIVYKQIASFYTIDRIFYIPICKFRRIK